MMRLLVIGFVVLLLPPGVRADYCAVAPPAVVPSASFYAGPSYFAGPPFYTGSSFYPGPSFSLRPVPVASYYAPVVVAPQPAIACPVPAVSVPLAIPTPATAALLPVPTPRRSPVVPRANPEPVPGVSEFRETSRFARSLSPDYSFYRASYFDPSVTPRSSEKIVLTLTNASGKSVMVWLNGVRYLLVDGQALQREVGRDFTWQVEGREKEAGRVPAGQQGMNLVIDR